MPKVLTQYMKNVIKSTGYAIQDIAHSMAPNFFEMKEDAKSVASDLYRQIKEFGGPSEGGKSAIGKAKDTVNDVFKNMIEDISTGKFYNKERSDALMTDVAKSMGMDFDFDMDFGDDWGTGEDFDFDDTSDENIIKADRRNTRDTIVAIDTVGARLSNEIGQATMATGKMIATANLNATKALYSLNQKGFSQVTEGIIGLNNSITSLGAFMAPLSEHFQNSTKFFAETTKTLYDINNNLTAILKNTTPSPEAANNKYRQTKNTLSSLMSGDTFSFSAYKDMVKDNIKEAMGMYEMIGDFFGPLLKSGKGGKNFSPTGMLYTALLKKIIPSTFEQAVKSLDENLGHYIAGAMAKSAAKHKNDYSLSGILASIFLPKREYSDTLSTGNYIKGKVAWDGKSRKALVEVIPTYLSKILASIQGTDEEYRFDYDTGKFRSYKDIKAAKDKHLLEAAKSAFGDFYSDAKSTIGSKNDKKSQALQKELDAFILAAFKRGADYWDLNKKDLFNYKSKETIEDDIDPNERKKIEEANKKIEETNKEVKKLRDALALNGENADELLKILRSTLLEKKSDNGEDYRIKRKYARTIGNVEIARNKMANTMREWSASGDNIYNTLYNNSFALGRTHTDEMKIVKGAADFGKLNASYQQTVIKYLDNITKLIAGLYTNGVVGGKKKKGKGGVKTGNIDEIINNITGNKSKVNSSENTKEESTEEALKNSSMKNNQEDNDEISDEERARRMNDSLNSAVKNASDSLFGSNWKGAPRVGLQILRAPFDAATNFFNKINDGFNEFLWGDPNGSKEGIFSRIIKSADEKLDEIFKEGIGKTIKDGFKNIIKYFTGGEDEQSFFHKFGTNTFNSLKSVGRWFVNAGKEALFTPINRPKYQADNGTAASGRKVTKSGIVTVSEGELIVPSELNPYYHGKTDKKKQIEKENEIYNNYLGSFADGGTVVAQDLDSRRLDLINRRIARKYAAEGRNPKEKDTYVIGNTRYIYKNGRWVRPEKNDMYSEGTGRNKKRYIYQNGEWRSTEGSAYDTILNGIHSVTDSVKEAISSTIDHFKGKQTEEDKTRSAVKKAFLKSVGKEVGQEAKANNGAVGAGAAIGAIGSFLTGGLLGPIGGAAVGAAAGLIIKSEKVQNLLFGKLGENGEREGGLINKEISNFIQKHGMSIGKGAALGTVGGLFMGSPVAGLILGSAVGFANSSEDFQDKLFGARVKDENGNYTGERIDNGMISKSLQEYIKKNVPRGIAGGVAGYLLKPIGSSPTLNLILGAAVGFAASSERFKNFMFGEKNAEGKRTGGLAKKIQEKIIWNIDDIAHNAWNELKGFGKNITIFATDAIKNITSKLGRILAGRIGGNKLGNFILKTLGIGANAGTGLIGGILGKVNRGLKRHLGKTGRDIYDRRFGRNLTAEERNRVIRGYDTSDEAIEKGNTYSKIDAILAGIKDEKELEMFRSGLGDIIDPVRNMYSRQEKALTFAEAKAGKYLTKGNKKKILRFVKNGGSEADLEKILDIYPNSDASDYDKGEYAKYRDQLKNYILKARQDYENAGKYSSDNALKVTEALKKADLDVGNLSKYELTNMRDLLKTESKRIEETKEEKIAKSTNEKIEEGNELLKKIQENTLDKMKDDIHSILDYIKPRKVGYGKEESLKASVDEGRMQHDKDDGHYYKTVLGTKKRVSKIRFNLHNAISRLKNGETDEEYINRIRNTEAPIQSFNGNFADDYLQSTVSENELIIPVNKNTAKSIKLKEAQSGLVASALLNTQTKNVVVTSNAVEKASKYVEKIAQDTNKIATGGKFDSNSNTFIDNTGKVNKINSADKDAKTTIAYPDMFGGIHQYSENNQGELTEQKNDRETDESNRRIDEFRDAIKRLSGAGLGTGIGATILAAAASAKTADGMSSLLSLIAPLLGKSGNDTTTGTDEGGSGVDLSGADATLEKSGGSPSLLQTMVKGWFGLKIADKIFGNKTKTTTGKTNSSTSKAGNIVTGIAKTLKELVNPGAKATEALSGWIDDAFAEFKWIIDPTNPNGPTPILKSSEEGKALTELLESEKIAKADKIDDAANLADDVVNAAKKPNFISRTFNAIKNGAKKLFGKVGNTVKTGAKAVGNTVKKGLTWIKNHAKAILKWVARIAVGITVILKFAELRKPKFVDLTSEFVEPGISYTESKGYKSVFGSLSEFKSYCSRPDYKTYYENHPFGAIIQVTEENFYFPYHILSKAAETLSKDPKAIEAGIIGDFKSENKKRSGTVFEALQYDYYDYTYMEDVGGIVQALSQLVTGGRHVIGFDILGNNKKTRFVQDVATFGVKDFTFYKMYGAWESTKGIDGLYDEFCKNIGTAVDKSTKNETLGDVATLAAIAVPEVLLASLGIGYYIATKGIISSISDVTKSIAGTKVTGYFEWHDFNKDYKAGALDGFLLYTDPFWEDLDLIPKPNENLDENVKFSYATHAGAEEQNTADSELANARRLVADTKSERQLKREAYATIVKDYYDDLLSRIDNVSIQTTNISDDTFLSNNYKTTKEFYENKRDETLALIADERTDERAIINKLIAEQTALNEQNKASTEKIYAGKDNLRAEVARAYDHANEASLLRLQTAYSDLNNSKEIDKYKPQHIMDYSRGNHYYVWPDGTKSLTADKYPADQAKFDQTNGIYTWPDGKKTKKGQYSDDSYYSGSGSGLSRQLLSGKGSNITGEFISQYDPAYANKKIFGRPFADAGCGPSVAAMAASTFGVDLPMNEAISASSSYQNRGGVEADYFDTVLGKKGIDTDYTEDKNTIYRDLQAGKPVVMLGNDPKNGSKSISPWGPDNHYVLGRGITNDGQIVVQDPEMDQPTVYSSKILNNTKLGISTGYSAGASNMKLVGLDGETSDNYATEAKATPKMQKMLDDAISRNNSEWYSQDYARDGGKLHDGKPGDDGGPVSRRCSDCSEFVGRMYRDHFGVDLGANTEEQVQRIRDGKVPNVKMMAFNAKSRDSYMDQLKPGDILYFKTKNARKGSNGDVTHVELYAGKNKLVGQDGVGPGEFRDSKPNPHGSGPTYRSLANEMYSTKYFPYGMNNGTVEKVPKYDRFLGYARYSGAGTREEIKEQVYAWLTNNGYSAAAACGIMGNIEQESSFDPTNLTPEGAIAAGLFQWHDYTAYKTNPTNYEKMDRFGGLAKLAAENGRDWTDVEMQLQYMDYEFSKMNNWLDPKNSSDPDIKLAGKGGYYSNKRKKWITNGTFANAGLDFNNDGTTYDNFKKLDDPAKAAQYFEAAFERAGNPNMKRRMEKAVEFYNTYSGQHFTYDPSKYTIAVAGTTTGDGNITTLANIDTSNMSASQKLSTFMDYIFDGIMPGTTQNVDTDGTGATDGSKFSAYGDATNIQEALVNYAKSREDSEHYSQDYRETTRNGIYQSDCSSFAQRAYKTVANVNIGSNTTDQYTKAKSKEGVMDIMFHSKGKRGDVVKDMQPGDLVYWYTKGHRGGAYDDISHVEMYAGDGKLIGQDASGPDRTGPHTKTFSTFRANPDKFLMVTRLKKDIMDKLNGKMNLERAMSDGTWEQKSKDDENKVSITGTRGTPPNMTYIWGDGKETTEPTRPDLEISHAKYLGFYDGSHHWEDGYSSTSYNRPNWSASGSGQQMVTMEKILKKYKNKKPSKVSTPDVKVESTPISGSGSTLKPISVDKFTATKHVVHSSKPAYSGGASGNKRDENIYKAFFEAVVNVLSDIKTNTSVTPALASSMVAFASNTKSELSMNTNIIKKQLQASLQEKHDSETEAAINNLSSQLASIIDG